MPSLTTYHIDAFANGPFTGNPAAICVLEEWLDDASMQAIAEQHNLAETSFLVPRESSTAAGNNTGEYDLRWFTPTTEVDLCGHATLAAAHALHEEYGLGLKRYAFHTRSGELLVDISEQDGGSRYSMALPGFQPVSCPVPGNSEGDKQALVPPLEEALEEALGVKSVTVAEANYYIVELADQASLEAVNPNHQLLKQLPKCVAVTAKADSSELDFVSRFFGIVLGIEEDPVTGSAHCCLAPYWANKLAKTKLAAKQISARGGLVGCEVLNGGDKVVLSGGARTFLSGEIWW